MAMIGKQKFLRRWIDKLLYPPAESPDFQAWKQKLFRDRLKICFWIWFICWIAFAIKDFIQIYNLESEYVKNIIAEYGIPRLKMYRHRTIYSFVVNASSWSIQGYRWLKDGYKRYTTLIFLNLFWTLTLYYLIVGTLFGEPYLGDARHWVSIFLGLAILIPVCWRIHLTAQLVLIVYYVGVIPVLGILNVIEVKIPYIVDPETLVPLLLSCPISTLSVAMYERSQRQEFESRRELKVFLHSVTHDLKTPVMASLIVLDNILQQPGSEITLDRSILERLYQGSDRTFRIVDSLIEAHSTEVNGIKLVPQSCRIQDLVNSVLIDLQPVLLQHRALVNNHLQNNLPDIWADPIQLWRVLNNLIGNALKHNPNRVCITIAATVENNYLHLSVSDDGVGISATQSDRLFKLYTRGKRSRYMPGLGIGLYLSQQIITAHNGEIGVISNLGHGSTFWFTVPCQPK